MLQLTFELVEDISLAIGSRSSDQLPSVNASRIGPLLELRHIQKEIVGNSNWLSTPYLELLANIKSRPGFWYEPQMEWQGFITVACLIHDPLAWIQFSLKAKRAATAAGFSPEHAGQLVAAIGELYNNVFEHSRNYRLGYVAFTARVQEFEFVVADGGIGVLDSLRLNPSYHSLADSGTALERALTEGVSRHSEPGRGNGFRPIFVGLANISESVRFRSGDYARTLIRMNDGSIKASTRQMANLRGLFCSVTCIA